MATYQILYWFDIPVQVKASVGRNRRTVALSDRFSEAMKQVAIADRLILSKGDMVASHSDPAGFAALRARLHEINPRASMHDSVNGRIDTAILRCKTDDDAEAAFRDFSDWIAATADHCHEHDCHDPDHDHLSLIHI